MTFLSFLIVLGLPLVAKPEISLLKTIVTVAEEVVETQVFFME